MENGKYLIGKRQQIILKKFRVLRGTAFCRDLSPRTLDDVFMTDF